MSRVFLHSWNGSEWLTGSSSLSCLEKGFSKTAVAVSNCQMAIQMCMELFGARSNPIPCIMPVTASRSAIAGVMRSGGHPYLVDIDSQDLQMSSKDLQEALEELQGAVVLLTRPAGQPVSQRLLDIAEKYYAPKIIDAGMLPEDPLYSGDAFCVYDLSTAIGTGALIAQPYAVQRSELTYIRDGLLGLSAALPELFCEMSQRRLLAEGVLSKRQEHSVYVMQLYENLIKNSTKIKPVFSAHYGPHYFIEVEDGNKVIESLVTSCVEADRGVKPLHKVEDMRNRWQESPNYPVADALCNKIVALPVHPGITDELAKSIVNSIEAL